MLFALSNLELPVRLRFERPMTDEELMRFCAENELLRVERDVNGELIVSSPSGSECGGVETDVATELNVWARSDGRGKVFGSNAGRCRMARFERRMRIGLAGRSGNGLTETDRKRFAPICPEFVIEVRSESDRLAELQAKMQMWLTNGAELAWLVDPSRKTVEVYRPGREAEVLEGGSAVEGDGPVAGFVLDLG